MVVVVVVMKGGFTEAELALMAWRKKQREEAERVQEEEDRSGGCVCVLQPVQRQRAAVGCCDELALVGDMRGQSVQRREHGVEVAVEEEEGGRVRGGDG